MVDGSLRKYDSARDLCNISERPNIYAENPRENCQMICIETRKFEVIHAEDGDALSRCDCGPFHATATLAGNFMDELNGKCIEVPRWNAISDREWAIVWGDLCPSSNVFGEQLILEIIVAWRRSPCDDTRLPTQFMITSAIGRYCRCGSSCDLRKCDFLIGFIAVGRTF